MEWLVYTPDRKRVARVKDKNMHLLPKRWQVERRRGITHFYEKKTGLVADKYKGLVELKTEDDFIEFFKPTRRMGLLFGKSYY